mgnify:CR=1 FL=1
MQRIIIVIFAFTAFSFIQANDSFWDNFNITRISTNFNGSAYNGSSILVYGDGGIILKSTTGGSKWEQINLNDSINIIDMVNINSNFFGVSNRKYIIFSNDNATTWNYKDFGNSKFYRILKNGEYLYALLERNIWVLNESLEKIKEYWLNIDSSYYDGVFVNNYLVYSSGKGKLGYINLENDQQGIIDISSMGLCNDCPVPVKLISNKINLVYFLLGKGLYQYDFHTNIAKFIFMPLKLSNSAFCANEYDIYHIYSVKFPNNEIDSIYFGKADKVNNTFVKIKQPINDRYIVNTNFSHLNFIAKDSIIAVGKGKLIYFSYDGGLNWELKSLLNVYSAFFFFDKMNACMIAPYAKFIHTKNGGVTWLPQLNHSKVYYQNTSFKNPTSLPSIRFFNNKMNGFFFGESVSQPNDTNLIHTKDGGNSVKISKINELQHYTYQVYPLVTKCFNKTLIVTHRNITGFPFFVKFDILGDDFNIEKSSYILNKIFFHIANLNDTLFAIEIGRASCRERV